MGQGGDKRGRGVWVSYLLSGGSRHRAVPQPAHAQSPVKGWAARSSAAADECEKADWEQQQQQQSPRTTTSQDPASTTDPAPCRIVAVYLSYLFEIDLISNVNT